MPNLADIKNDLASKSIDLGKFQKSYLVAKKDLLDSDNILNLFYSTDVHPADQLNSLDNVTIDLTPNNSYPSDLNTIQVGKYPGKGFVRNGGSQRGKSDVLRFYSDGTVAHEPSNENLFNSNLKKYLNAVDTLKLMSANLASTEAAISTDNAFIATNNTTDPALIAANADAADKAAKRVDATKKAQADIASSSRLTTIIIVSVVLVVVIFFFTFKKS